MNITQSHGQSGGNMSDKEVRFGIANTALWATATTDASNGSVNGGHDALTATGGAVPLVNIFVMGSELYHDLYRWPMKDKATFEGWKRDTSWGRLFDRYAREGTLGASAAEAARAASA